MKMGIKVLIGQGATEYLVLLAVVLIIALVGIALLGFFPGTANDAQIAESQIYWQGMSPIAIVDSSPAYRYAIGPYIWQYIRIRNTGTYRLCLSKILGGGNSISQYSDRTGTPINRDLTGICLSPGEETCFSDYRVLPGNLCNQHHIEFNPISAGQPYVYTLAAASPSCDSAGQGTNALKDFGFEYIVYVEAQAITKREIGVKPFIAKCAGTLS